MKKTSLSSLTLLALVVIGGCTSENNDNGTTSSSIEVSVTSDSATNLTGDTVDIVRTEGNNTNFKVEQKEGQSVHIVSTNIKTEEATEIVNSEFVNDSQSRELELIFTSQNNKFEVSLSVSGSEELSDTSTFTADQKYVEFIPYTSEEKNKLGVFVMSNDQNVITEIKNDLDNIKIPLDLEDLIEEPFEEEKQEKKTYYFNWFIDLLLVSLLLLPIVGIYNPNIFVKFENVYPFFLKTHNFLEKDNLRKILGGESESVDLKNAKPAVVVKESEVKKPKTNAEELKLIHSLANSLIKAEYKWECTEVTPKTIKKVISGIDCLRDREERIYFRSNLEKWKNGDFSNAVEVHNKVWSILEGNVGEAYDLDEESISKIKEKYY